MMYLLSMKGLDSNRLLDKKEKILSLWEERCLKEVPSADTVTKLSLRNSLPLYLDHLSESLSTNKKMDFKSVFARDQEATRIGKMHGTDRAENRSYELTEVIFEYHILREVIFQILENEGPLESSQRDIILDSIEQAVNDAAVEFSEIHTDVQQNFVNILTHDLRNPIAAAKMNAELILMRADISKDGVISVNRIIESMNRLETMIFDLLDASKVRAGESLVLQFIPSDLKKMIQEVVDEMNVMHEGRILIVAQGEHDGVWGCDGLRRAVENLIGNAVKYSTPKTPITISLRNKNTFVEIEVHNQGSFIAAKEIPVLFQYYRRSKSAQEGTKSGWGIGLTLVKGVVDAHQGKIRVESAEKKGTSFILEIPFLAASLHAEKFNGMNDAAH